MTQSNEALQDQAVAIREGETLDTEALDRYLKAIIPDCQGKLQVSQFPGGASNLTYLVAYDNHSFVLRRPPFGRIAKSAHDMLREAKIISALKPVYPYVPKIIAQCDDHEILGCDFFVMERLTGMIPRQDFPKALNLEPEQTRRLCLQAIDALIELHQVDYEQAGLQHLGKGSGYMTRQISGWCDRFEKAKTPDTQDFVEVMRWLKQEQPEDCKTCVIHNDFRFDNIVFEASEPYRIIGVLDWEMATLGDPLMDLGNSLAYWIQADDEPGMQMLRRQPTHVPGMLTRQEVVAYYLEKTGLAVNDFKFYEIYGLFRLAAIIQQIYYRYYHKQTQDQRFAGFGHAVNFLHQRCVQLLG